MQDKLFLPGLRKLKHAAATPASSAASSSVRGEFGYWVFEGDWQPAQRPCWNYRKEDGGGIILDMLCHWRYVLDNLFGEVKAVSCLGATHIPERVDEAGKRYDADADDAAYATFELEGGVDRPDQFVLVRRACAATTSSTFQVDGTHGSAVAGLHALLHAAPRQHAEAGVESRPAADRSTSSTQWDEVPDNQRLRQRLQGAVGGCSSATSPRTRRGSTT